MPDWLAEFKAQVQATAAQGAGSGSGVPPEAPSPSPAPAQPSVDLSELEQALEAAGLEGPARTDVALYMALKLEPERCGEAVRKLTDASDPNAQKRALDALKTLTEKDLGRALVESPDVDDTIPF